MIKIYLPIIKYLNTDAITICSFAFFAQKNPSQILISHEQIHIDQIKKDGVFKFYFKYLLEYLLNRLNGLSHQDSYMAISYEIEAYANQSNLNYKVK